MKTGGAPPIARLPLEILEAFVEFSPLSSQLSIARVSRSFHSLALRSLYRNVALCSPKAVAACCRTLAQNAKVASTVRSLLVSYTLNTYTSYLLASFYTVIRNALCSLPNLHTLRLLVQDRYYATVLQKCTFPSLHRFECCLTLSHALVVFLNRHPKLTYLQVSPHENTYDLPDEEPLPSMVLPKLQYFSGNGQSVPIIGESSPLRAAIVIWDASDTPLDLVISALQRCGRDTLDLLSCRRRGWNMDLIEMISLRLPDIISLHMSNVLLVDVNSTAAYGTSVSGFLTRFSQLQRLCINCIDYWEMGNIQCDMEVDFATVTNWGSSCPTLVEIALPHSDDLSWYKISRNLWIPDPTHALGEEWLSDAIVLKKYPALELFIDSLQERSEKSTSVNPIQYMETIDAVRERFFDLLRTRHADVFTVDTPPTLITESAKRLESPRC